MKRNILSFFVVFIIVFFTVGTSLPVNSINIGGEDGQENDVHSHILTEKEAVKPNCTEDGNSQYWICSECGRMFSDECGTSEIASIPAIPALGHSFADGICMVCGAERTWTFDELSGTITILSNEGTTEWRAYIEPAAVKNIEILQGVTRIEDYAFMDCLGVTLVTVPNGVTYLGWYSFYGCENLETVMLPTGINEIGYAAFNRCTNLKSLIIPSSIQTISLPIFDYCENLESVGYPAKMQIMVVPTTTAKYSYDINLYGDVTVRIINNGGRETFTIPDVIEGKKVTKIINSIGGSVIHNHSGGTASCIKKAVCAVCKQEYGEFAAHTWNGGEITVAPTCTVNGLKTYACTIADCGATKTEEILAAGHTWNDGEETVAPTCTINGLKIYTCTAADCGATKTEEVSAVGHIEDNGTVTKQPTETETGVKTFKCTVCGTIIRTKIIPSTGSSVTTPSRPSNTSGSNTQPAIPSANNEPYISDDNSQKGWEVISGRISNTPEGGTVTVTMNGTTELPEKILSLIQGRDVNLILEMDGCFVWTINGLNVAKVKNVDLGVKKISKIPQNAIQEFFGDVTAIQLELSHNGNFGFIATLNVDIGKTYSGMFANSYCYRSKKFEFGDSGEIVNGKVKLRFDHASKWLITIDKFPIFEDVSSAAGIYENSKSYNYICYILSLNLVVVAIILLAAIKKSWIKC